MIWFTSDTHFWHTNIITYCGRPWVKADGQPDVEMMNLTLVSRWNALVGPDDDVWHLGDFSFGNHEVVSALVRLLNGRIHLVKGNHDRHSNKWYMEAGFVEVVGSKYLEVGGKTVLLVHRPPGSASALRLGKKSADVVLCGHVHEKWSRTDFHGVPVINVGVDVRDFKPASWDALGL